MTLQVTFSCIQVVTDGAGSVPEQQSLCAQPWKDMLARLGDAANDDGDKHHRTIGLLAAGFLKIQWATFVAGDAAKVVAFGGAFLLHPLHKVSWVYRNHVVCTAEEK